MQADKVWDEHVQVVSQQVYRDVRAHTHTHTHAHSTTFYAQAGLHEQYGGVKPDVARDAHARAICSTVDACFTEAKMSAADLTAVAVTVGPGLSLCLQVGGSVVCVCGV